MRLSRISRLAFVLVPVGFALHCGGGGDGGGAAPEDDASAPHQDATLPDGAPSGGDAQAGDDTGGPQETPDSALPEAGSPADVSVLQVHHHLNRDGLFVDPALTHAALASGKIGLDKSFTAKVTGNVYASPLYVEKGVGGKGTFYVVTASNNLDAIDEATGALVLPEKNFGDTPTAYNGMESPGGIIGTPAIDLGTRLMVFDAKVKPSSHVIHAVSIDDFSEKWSVDVSTLSAPGVGAFASEAQSAHGGVLIVGGIAYVAYGGYWGDGGNYHGWVVGVPLSGTGAKAYATPNTQCGMWAAGGLSSDGTNVFVSTGNGKKGATWAGEFAVLRLQPGPVFSGNAADYWFSTSANGDQDLGGTTPLVVDVPSMTPSSLLVQLGKDGNAYLLDRGDLKGAGAPLASKTIMGGSGELVNVPAVATIAEGTFVATISNDNSPAIGCPAGQSGNLVVFKIDPAAANKMSVAWCANNRGGGSPSITTSDGTHDAIVWTFGTDSKGGTKNGDGQLHAWDLATGTPLVTTSDAVTGTRRFTTPIAVHGRVMIVGDGALYAYKP